MARSAPPLKDIRLGTFSRMNAFGRDACTNLATSSASVPRPDLSATPGPSWRLPVSSALPTLQKAKGWQGKPAVSTSCGGISSESNDVTSPRHSGPPKLALYTARALASSSDAKTQTPPSGASPEQKPPMPANSSVNEKAASFAAFCWTSRQDSKSDDSAAVRQAAEKGRKPGTQRTEPEANISTTSSPRTSATALASPSRSKAYAAASDKWSAASLLEPPCGTYGVTLRPALRAPTGRLFRMRCTCG
mmetsp:Transcript_108845/g.318478  ORF Transcript_108845/g.318478 Transcript_108845/m.318478 type:complete len:248 (-) Transcript_108845:124-867(-)